MIKPCMWPFWTDTSEFWSRGIRWATGGLWSHMGIGFDMPDGERCYFEALFSEGFTGPHNPARFASFLAAKPTNRLCVVRLDPSVFGYGVREVIETHARATEWARKGGTEHKGYAKAQLAGMLLFERFGIGVRKSENRQVCSEAASRLIEPVGIDLRSRRNNTHDKVSPQSAWERTMELIAGYAEYTDNGPVMPGCESWFLNRQRVERDRE